MDGLFYFSEEFFVWPHDFLLEDHFDFQPIDFAWDKKPRGTWDHRIPPPLWIQLHIILHIDMNMDTSAYISLHYISLHYITYITYICICIYTYWMNSNGIIPLLSIIPVTLQWGWYNLSRWGLSESRDGNPVVYHHFRHSNSTFKVYRVFRLTPVQLYAMWERKNKQSLVIITINGW